MGHVHTLTDTPLGLGCATCGVGLTRWVKRYPDPGTPSIGITTEVILPTTEHVTLTTDEAMRLLVEAGYEQESP